MSVVPSAISSFGTLFLLSSNTVLSVKSLIAIILVVEELNFIIQDFGEWRLKGGGGGGWMHRIQYLQVLSQSSSPLQQ